MNHEILYHLATFCASVDSANNINKLSLVGMQLPEKYKEKFDISSEGPSPGVTSQVTRSKRRAFARNAEFLLVFFR
jgi:hypothetical protein